MTDENVVHLPTLLERLAGKLKDYLHRHAANRNDWIEIQEAICLTLAEARSQFAANIEFGQWCDGNGFDFNHQTRAAAVAMGGEPEPLRKCLEATERRSLLQIYRFEFGRFTQMCKTQRRRKQAKRDPNLSPTPKMQRARDAYDALVARGQRITEKAVADLAGVSIATVKRALAAYKRTGETENPGPDPLDPADMKTLNLAIKKARAEIREEIKEDVYRELDVYVRHMKERSERADRILGAYKGVMTKDAFRKIKACLHPDHNSFKFAAEALQLFSELEPVLLRPDDPVMQGPPLPSTAAELMARRRR